MPAPSVDPGDLLDLKLMPAWVKEPSAREDYAAYEGDEGSGRPERPPPRLRNRETAGRERRRGDQRPSGRQGKRDQDGRPGPDRRKGRELDRRQQPPPKPEQPLDIVVRFLPRPTVLENVVSQVKAEALAYSLFFLARSFLEKPQRYEVSLKAKPESPLYRLGEAGPVSSDRGFIESNGFRLGREQFYRVEVTQSEPLKGNFTSVARCRLSGTMLGPTNHHDYQRKLRALYEQRFSRRMSFPEYQRQIEIVSDPATVEQWKEEARTLRTFVSLREPAVTLQNEAEAERDFRLNHLPGLIQSVEEAVIDGISSRQLADGRLRRHIEQAWSVEYRSPSQIMQELAKRFREAGLQIFRHRKGMLFVSSIRVRPLEYVNESISPQVKAILELVAASPRIRRKEVADKLLAEAGEDLESRKLALASDLRWLISEGYLIEFNDGALDLPRVKIKTAPAGTSPGEPAPERSDDSVPEAGTVAILSAAEQTAEKSENASPGNNPAVSELGFA